MTRETLDDLLRLRGILTDEASDLTAFAKRAGIAPWTLLRLRTGQGQRNHVGTILALAAALRLGKARVRAAIEASRGK